MEGRLRTRHGFTLIELLISVALFGMMFVGIWGGMNMGFRVIKEAQGRVEASVIANQQIELIRNLSFNNIGTSGGIPSGTLTADQTVTRNGIHYTVNTDVIYVDDAFDGVAPINPISADYKRGRVTVYWKSSSGATSSPVIAVTDVAPKGVEGQTGGTLRVTASDALGQVLQGADVHIVNTDVTPNIDTIQQTNTSGQVILPGAPACNACYQISATKVGYSTDRTYGDDEVFQPTKAHLSVLLGQVSDVALFIDYTASLTTTVFRANSTSTISNIPIILKGYQSIGNDSSGVPVLRFATTTTADEQGIVQFSALAWDTYMFSVSGTSTGYAIANEILPQPIVLDPAEVATTSLFMATNTPHSLLFSVQEPGGSPMVGAAVHLNNTTLGYDSTLVSAPSSGQAFFPNLLETTYDADVTATGYDQLTAQISVLGATRSTLSPNPT